MTAAAALPPKAATASPGHGTLPTVSVIICAYTGERWELLVQSVASAQSQNFKPVEIIVCIDHNEWLFQRCNAHWATQDPSLPPVRVIQNKYAGRLGSARNTGAEAAAGAILAFLDDDATADRDWLERLVACYSDAFVAAVGGRPVPVYERSRPEWFPTQFDWVFGCAYDGLPTMRAPVARLIGASMSIRKAQLARIGGFHSDNHDDLDMCHRVAKCAGQGSIIYEPQAIVRHFASKRRLTWSYFWRRCFHVNRGKVEAFARMGSAASLGAETRFVGYALKTAVPRELLRAGKGDVFGPVRAGAILAGLAFAAFGHFAGRVQWALRRARERKLESGGFVDAPTAASEEGA